MHEKIIKIDFASAARILPENESNPTGQKTSAVSGAQRPITSGDIYNIFRSKGDQTAEKGITDRSVMNCIAAISEHNLDLDVCIGKGGSWKVAAEHLRAKRMTEGLRSELGSIGIHLIDEE